MAVSHFATWQGEHELGENLILEMKYAVYADMSNGNVQPFIRLNGCRVRSKRDVSSQISTRAPLTIKIQLNGEGTRYSFSSGSNIQHQDGTMYDMDTGEWDGYYYINFSSSTNINIPKNGEEFTLNLAVTTKNNEEYEIIQHACGPVSNTLTGPTSIDTGTVSTYALLNAVWNDAHYMVEATMHTHFPSEGGTGYMYNGFASEYSPASSEPNEFSQISFVPLRNNATVGDVGRARISYESGNYIVYSHYYYTGDPDFGETKGYTTIGPKRILIATYSLGVTVTARAEVNAALRPDFDRVIHIDHSSPDNIDDQIARYGAAIQSKAYYDVWISYENFTAKMLKYGAKFTSATFTDYLDGTPVVGNTRIEGSHVRYTHGYITNAGNNLIVQYRMTDSYGFVTTYTDTIDVRPYSDPVFTEHSVRRCSLVEEGSGSDYYPYDGNIYKVNDYGEYALIEWGINVTPLDDINSKHLEIRGVNGVWTINLPSYACNGYFVTPADPEKSYDVNFTLRDDFVTVKYTVPLNTALAAIDFLRGGNGMAFGKVAEDPWTFDIHRDWNLAMPYSTYVQNYNLDGTSVNLYDWLQRCMTRMQAIIDNRDVLIYGSSYDRGTGIATPYQLWDGSTASCIPAEYGTVSYPGHGGVMTLNRVRANSFAGLLIGDGIIVQRTYLKFASGSSGWTQSFIAQGWGKTDPKPTIYIMGSKPTTINQSTGVPNGTILTTRTLAMTMHDVGESVDGYTTGYGYTDNIKIDISSYLGSQIWILIVVRNGSSPSGFYQYTSAETNIGELVQSNHYS